ncbi:MAG: hypothetical protein JJU22_16965 [Gammaproteobacteria bacterium]|nr:hypothetical protein [Gammaproteobacteria bacterium]
MAHVSPRDPAALSSLTPLLDAVKSAMGFVPNSMLTMAHLPHLSDAERAALALAFAAGSVPNESDQQHFAALREHFREQQIIQLVAVIALFGFLNRWNDILAIALESQPQDFAADNLAALQWTSGKHAAKAQQG